jgi:hypothetical protein
LNVKKAVCAAFIPCCALVLLRKTIQLSLFKSSYSFLKSKGVLAICEALIFSKETRIGIKK